MKNDDSIKMIIGILVVSIIILLFLVIYLVFFKLEKSNFIDEIINDTSNDELDFFENLKGIYEYSDDSKNIILEISEMGIGKYQYEENCADEKCIYQNYEGKISIGINNIFLIDEDCQTVLNDDGCNYSNCLPIVSFDYNNNRLSLYGNELEKK